MSEMEILDAPAKVAEYKPVDAGLATLRQKLHGVVFDVSTTAGDKAARAARAECVTLRTTVEKIRKEIKAPLLAKAKLLDDEAKRITAEVAAIEAPIDAQIKAEEERKAAVKAEKERIEQARQKAIQDRIWMLGQYAVSAAGLSSAKIAAMREALGDEPITTDLYAERTGEAMALQADVAAKLDAMHSAAVAQEEEAERLAVERAELERQRQEQEAAALREREAEAARLAEERRALEAERAEQRRQEEAAAAEARRREEDAAAALRAQQEELDRQRREFEAQQAAARRAEQERQEAAARAQREKVEADAQAAAEAAAMQKQREQEQFAANGPGDVAIVRKLADVYAVEVGDVMGWLKKFDYHAADEQLAAENCTR